MLQCFLNQLVGVQSTVNGQPSATIEYVYDGNGNRYSKTVNGQTRYYSYDTSGNIVSEYKRVILNGSEESQTLVRYVRDAGGKAISMINYEDRSSNNEARTFYFIYNGHGDVTALTDSAGTVVATYSYDEFGSQLTVDGRQMTDNGIYNPIRYSGAHNAYYDSETSLYKMGTRYYQSDVGRWLTRDSYKGDQETPQSQNRYIYCQNNPVSKIDPSGFWDSYKHHYLWTEQIARQLKFKYPAVIAKANMDMDANWAHTYTKGLGYHFNLNDNSLTKRVRACLRTAIHWRNKGNEVKASIWLGKGLHSLQDYYAHPHGVSGPARHIGDSALWLSSKVARWYTKRTKIDKYIIIGQYESQFDDEIKNSEGASEAKRNTKIYLEYFKHMKSSNIPGLI